MINLKKEVKNRLDFVKSGETLATYLKINGQREVFVDLQGDIYKVHFDASSVYNDNLAITKIEVL